LTKRLYKSIIFWDAKRPVTKTILSQIDVVKLIDQMDVNELRVGAQSILDSIHSTVDLPSTSDAIIERLSAGSRHKKPENLPLF